MFSKLNKYAGWIIGGIITIIGTMLAILFAVKQEKREIAKMKAKVVIGKAQKELNDIRVERAKLDVMDEVSRKKSEELTHEMVAKDKEIAAMKQKVKEMSNDEVVDEFNRMYHSR